MNAKATSRIQLKKTLTLFQVVMIGLAYIQPMTLFDTFGIVSQITNGHVPTAYIMALLGILLTALSYGKLVRRYPSAGSAYTYTQKSINPHLGFMVGWSSLLDYLFMPMINILLAKIYLAALFPSIPPWIFVAVLVFIMTAVNIIGINLVANLNSIIVFVQLAIIVVFVLFMVDGLSNGAGQATLVSQDPFFNKETQIVPIIAGATILCFSFLGFDGISSLSEETKDAERIVPTAIFLTALVGGVIFIAVSYFVQLYFPTSFTFAKPDESLPEIALYVGGKLFQSIMLCITCTTVLASGLAAHAGVARLLYVMGRDRVFPERIFAYVHYRTQTPLINTILVGLLAMSAIFFDLEIAASLINFGALVAFTFVNLSVIAQYYIREQRNKTALDHLNYLIMPVLGAITVGILWINLDIHSMILGSIWASVGFAYLIVLTKGFRKAPPQFLSSVEQG